ncbi:hypothetical protein GGR54DRAFT_185410 [Hypoxylon sp. NC1633]|nr:hypothetical protein GGR54DRAFT_185410 [Hypoxylon sp. NC1633]
MAPKQPPQPENGIQKGHPESSLTGGQDSSLTGTGIHESPQPAAPQHAHQYGQAYTTPTHLYSQQMSPQGNAIYAPQDYQPTYQGYQSLHMGNHQPSRGENHGAFPSTPGEHLDTPGSMYPVHSSYGGVANQGHTGLSTQHTPQNLASWQGMLSPSGAGLNGTIHRSGGQSYPNSPRQPYPNSPLQPHQPYGSPLPQVSPLHGASPHLPAALIDPSLVSPQPQVPMYPQVPQHPQASQQPYAPQHPRVDQQPHDLQQLLMSQHQHIPPPPVSQYPLMSDTQYQSLSNTPIQQQEMGQHPSTQAATGDNPSGQGQSSQTAPGANPSGQDQSSQAAPIPNPTAGVDGWQIPEGFRNLLVRNAPVTESATFSTAREREQRHHTGNWDFIATKRLDPAPIAPARRHRLPCEIQRDRLDLIKGRDDAPDEEKDEFDRKIKALDDEEVLIYAPGQDAGPTPKTGKVRATKGRRAAPDSTKKRKRPATDPDNEDGEDGDVDAEARKIKKGRRPEGGKDALEYDLVQILWHDPELSEPSDKAVMDGIQAFGNYVTDLWNKSKDIKKKVDQARSSNNTADLESLEPMLEESYNSICIVIEAAIDFGYWFTLTQLGTHKKLLAALCALLQQRFASEDYGPLPKAVLQLMSLFVTVETHFIVDKLKFDRVRQKFRGNLDDESTQYMDRIFDNAKKRSESEAESPQKDSKGDNAKSVAVKVPKKAATTVAKDTQTVPKSLASREIPFKQKAIPEVKKPTDYSGLGSARKISSLGAKANLSSPNPAKRPGSEDVDSRPPKKAAIAIENLRSNPPAAPPASAQPRPRPAGSMLPGKPRGPVKSQPKKPVAEQEAAVTSNIGSLLASIETSNEPPKVESVRAPETPEDAARRLRKESRRHLRVSWKSGTELTSIRVFEHEPSEDRGRDEAMLRDARDNRSEGQALKDEKNREKDREDEDDEVDEKDTLGIWLIVKVRDWSTPIAVDISLPHQFVTRGGRIEINSTEKKAMEERERRELMAIYTSVGEIPSTPRSPPATVDEVGKRLSTYSSRPAHEAWLVALPPNNYNREEITRRWLDHLNLGRDVALFNALTRAPAGRKYPASNPKPLTYGESQAEVARLLQLDAVRYAALSVQFDPAHMNTELERHPAADPKAQRDIDALMDTFVQYINKHPFPTAEPPVSKTSDQDQSSGAVVLGSIDYMAIWRQVEAIKSKTLEEQAQKAEEIEAPVPSVAQILAKLKESTSQPTPAYALTQAYQQNLGQTSLGYHDHASLPFLPQAQQSAQPYTGPTQQGYGVQADLSSAQMTQTQYDGSERGDRKDFQRVNREHKGINRALIGTKPCTFWAKNQCNKGDKCTFRHDPNDLQ